MTVLLLACLAAGCTSAWMVYMLFGPAPAPRRPLLVPRMLPEGPRMRPSDLAVAEAWIEGPTMQEVRVRRADRPIAEPVLRRPRFDAPRAFEVEEATRIDA